jgi:son of sevenless-like protein
MFSKPAPEPILPRDLNSFVFEELDPLEIARQLTLIEYSIFKTIQPKEFLNQGWSKSKKEINSPSILSMIRLFNKVSNSLLFLLSALSPSCSYVVCFRRV